MDLGEREHGGELIGGKLAANGNRLLVGCKHGEAVEFAYELFTRPIALAERPALGELVQHFDQAEALLVEVLRGKAHRLARRQILLQRRPIEHLHVDVKNTGRGLGGLGKPGVDLSSPAQRCLVRVAAEHIADGGTAGQHAGNDGKHTKNDKTGHYQPIPSADLCHLTSSLSHPERDARS